MFNTRAEYRLGCEHISVLSVFVPNSSHVQLTAEASIISCVCVIGIFIWICVRPTCFHVPFLFDEMLHYSGTYDGIEGSLGQTVTGGCSSGRLTSTWSALQFFWLPVARLIEFAWQFALFVFDFVQGMGGVLDVRWAHNGIVTTGHYCTAQGIVQQIGELGVALITLVCLLSYCLWI
jgi:hypothetical protein